VSGFRSLRQCGSSYFFYDLVYCLCLLFVFITCAYYLCLLLVFIDPSIVSAIVLLLFLFFFVDAVFLSFK